MAKFYLTLQHPQSAMRVESDSVEKLKIIAIPAGNNIYKSDYRIMEVLEDGSERQVCYSTTDGWKETKGD